MRIHGSIDDGLLELSSMTPEEARCLLSALEGHPLPGSRSERLARELRALIGRWRSLPVVEVDREKIDSEARRLERAADEEERAADESGDWTGRNARVAGGIARHQRLLAARLRHALESPSGVALGERHLVELGLPAQPGAVLIVRDGDGS